jgi:hypothetical protein
VAAEARLSIIETWPDRQKIQKARGKGSGKRMCAVSWSNLLHSFERKLKFSRENDARIVSCVRSHSARCFNIAWNYSFENRSIQIIPRRIRCVSNNISAVINFENIAGAIWIFKSRTPARMQRRANQSNRENSYS